MAGTESGQENKERDILDVLANIRANRINIEDLSEENRVEVGIEFTRAANNSKYNDRINARANEIMTKGRKEPLYTPEELAKAKHHRKRRTKPGEYYVQSEFLPEEQVEGETYTRPVEAVDPHKKLFKEIGKIEKTYHHQGDTILSEEVKDTWHELRDKIGLPRAQKGDPYFNDPFYRFLVFRVYQWDVFKIFGEYDLAKPVIPQALKSRIEEVKGYIGKLLDLDATIRDKEQMFHDFVREHEETWGIEDYVRPSESIE